MSSFSGEEVESKKGESSFSGDKDESRKKVASFPKHEGTSRRVVCLSAGERDGGFGHEGALETTCIHQNVLQFNSADDIRQTMMNMLETSQHEDTIDLEKAEGNTTGNGDNIRIGEETVNEKADEDNKNTAEDDQNPSQTPNDQDPNKEEVQKDNAAKRKSSKRRRTGSPKPTCSKNSKTEEEIDRKRQKRKLYTGTLRQISRK